MLRAPFNNAFPLAERDHKSKEPFLVTYGKDITHCVTCGLSTNATCRACGERCCGNCLMTPQHDATHK